MFTFGGASDNAPATPDRSQKRNGNFFASHEPKHPSTTPLGPPPGSSLGHASTTPVGPPPSSVKALYSSPSYNAAIPFPRNSLTNNAFGSSVPFASGYNGNNGLMNDNDDDSSMDEDDDRMSYSQRAVDRNGTLPDIDLGGIARSMAGTAAGLIEPQEMILKTESIVSALYENQQSLHEPSDQFSIALSTAVTNLLDVWTRAASSHFPCDFGSVDDAGAIHKAVILSSLQLALHHPEHEIVSDGRRTRVYGRPKPLAEILVKWLNTVFLSHQEDLDHLLRFEPNPTAAEEYWDSALTFLAHGDVAGVLRLLEAADFSQATSSLQDGMDAPGYEGAHLGNVRRVVSRLIQTLQTSPIIQTQNWDIGSSEWSFFRKRVEQALADLEHLAHGPPAVSNLGMSNKALSNSLGQSAFNMSASESRLPRTIYENIKFIYSQMLGNKSEIVASSTSWVDATVGLFIWGKFDDDASHNPHIRSESMRKSQSGAEHHKSGSSDLGRLASALRYVMSEHRDSELQVQTISEVEVGLACVFSGDDKGALGIMSRWSLTVGSAVSEISTLGGWLEPKSISDRLIKAFDESDLMVLGHGADSTSKPSRDATLTAYAQLLATYVGGFKERLEQRIIPGWQIAVQILSRLADHAQSRVEIAKVFANMQITYRGLLDQAVDLCSKLGLDEQVKQLLEQYADALLSAGEQYGEILILYARAGNDRKLTKLLNSLVSLSLSHSMAFPRSVNLDPALRTLVLDPKQMLAGIAHNDPEAAALLSARMSGYAMVRTFYDLRDYDAVSLDPSTSPPLRTHDALAALIAVIESAADSIHGGLYDDSVESVIEVDGLLVALGETLPFLDSSSNSIITASQAFTILRAIEDLTTVGSSLYEKCDQCLGVTIRNSLASTASIPSLTLQRGTSDLTNSTQFSLISSGVLESRMDPSSEGSGVLVDSQVSRVWDWRKGLSKELDGVMLISILRLQLARVIAKQWALGS